MINIKPNEFKVLSSLFYKLTGMDIPTDKMDSFSAKLEKRLNLHKLSNFSEYIFFIKDNSHTEIAHFINCITIHFTKFFREQVHFDYLVNDYLPHYLKDNTPENGRLRFWVSAVSTGEEAYSLAMVLDDYLSKNHPKLTFEILATDICPISIARAKNGVYSSAQLEKIPKRYRPSYTQLEKSSDKKYFQITNNIHEKIVWRVCNLNEKNISIKLKYPYKFHGTFSRNVFIYFNKELIQNTITQMEKLIKDDGFLIIGQSENLNNVDHRFSPCPNSIFELSKEEEPPEGVLKISIPKDKKIIKVMTVDDSKTINLVLSQILKSDDEIKYLGSFLDGHEAYQFLKSSDEKPDIIISDIHMPNMDGLKFLELQMRTYKIPTIMLSSISKHDAINTLKALELGACDYIEKNKDISKIANQIIEKIKIVSKSDVSCLTKRARPNKIKVELSQLDTKVILIGSSTGGPAALSYLVEQFDKNVPPIVIAQHMPAAFTKLLAERLNKVVSPEVKEVYSGDVVLPGHVYIAPGGKNIGFKINNNNVLTLVVAEPSLGDRHTPSVDYLFKSSLSLPKSYSITACILTGMGNDGSAHLSSLKERGFRVLIQDEKSSVVFGMNKSALDSGYVDEVHDIEKLGDAIINSFQKNRGTHKKGA